MQDLIDSGKVLFASASSILVTSLTQIDMMLKIIISLLTIWYLCRKLFGKPKARHKGKKWNWEDSVVWVAACLTLSGCTYFERKNAKLEAPMTELSRQFTTAIVDVLTVAPTNRETWVALDLARHDQQIEGLPLHPFDAAKLLDADKAEFEALQASYAKAEKLRVAKAKYEGQLQAIGSQAETDRNKSIFRRVWLSITGTIGIGGFIAVCFFCPALIPILGRILAWVVGKVPSVAGAVGVVGKDAFDAVVTGVENYRKRATSESLDNNLHREMDASHRKLVAARKKALKLEEEPAA
jgi:hypothetical protein